VQNSGTREGETLKPLVEPVPREPSLAPPSKGAEPGATDFIVEAVQHVPVARERVVPVVPAKDTAEPRMLQRQRRMHASSLFVTHGVQFAGYPSLVCPSLYDEASISASRAVMRKAEERATKFRRRKVPQRGHLPLPTGTTSAAHFRQYLGVVAASIPSGL
jgi:hypothetical protein